MSSQQFVQKPDIKISVKQTFGFESEIGRASCRERV